ncbi:Bug family tripartite tricarboxylate transporter substrate binding protein [Cupriavidus consociatus]|uniref:Bug family tripartite tricarboxylate transporter substrate binding protein n=1 Tax=Cupriavidus consociatus TaxID=2821357 RepID=UPI001AEB7FA9|nr:MULTISPECIES: tripartite tricarboxylate transporter substrate-binding protein [unclassified Cupriavidus]MBP0623365.1 tripartite tricarboxylate transporter substrate binding protein [Cupriavidus sp. LEh25]MDK2660062.1 tripartite tricarboxylate transporter substrate-binding protein [Cupriavidus sp. LEh21]
MNPKQHPISSGQWSITRRAVLALACGLAVSAVQPAWAQTTDYPKAGAVLRYVVPFPPAGLTDVMARLVAQQLGERWKVNVIVDNKPGANAMLGAESAARAAADGNTLLAVNMTHSVNATLFRGKSKLNFDKDLKPVALLAGTPILVVVPTNSKIRSLADLVAAAKAKSLNAGSSGVGTPSHMSLALFNQLNGTKILHVPYKGGSPSLTDLMGGQLDVIFSNFPESLPFVKSGKLRAIAIASGQRNPQVPDVPTTAEAGMPKLNVEQWTAVMVPGGTPDAVVQRLGGELVSIMATPEVANKARELGFRVDARGPRDFAMFWNSEVKRWRAVIESAGITPE